MGNAIQEDVDEFDAAMIALGFPPLQSTLAFEAAVDLRHWQSAANKDARTIASYIKRAMEAEVDSDERRRNWTYANYMIGRWKASDPNGLMNPYLIKQIDRNLKEFNAYNITVFERVNSVLGYPDIAESKNLIRGKE
jgi:hypothetical protein